jgi:hypothetical protein
MRGHRQRVLHHQVLIGQTPIQLIAVLIDDRAESDCDVTERDHDATPMFESLDVSRMRKSK